MQQNEQLLKLNQDNESQRREIQKSEQDLTFLS